MTPITASMAASTQMLSITAFVPHTRTIRMNRSSTLVGVSHELFCM